MNSVYDEFLKEIELLRQAPPNDNLSQDEMLKLWFEQFVYNATMVEALGIEWLKEIKRLNCNLKFTPFGKHIYMQRIKNLESDN